MNRLISENSDVAESLDLVYRLHALNTIQNNLSTLTMSGVISLDNAKLVNNALPVSFELTSGLGQIRIQLSLYKSR